MSEPRLPVRITLSIPSVFDATLGGVRAVKDYFVAQGLWPANVSAERWQIDPTTMNYMVEMTVKVPLPEQESAAPGEDLDD